MILVSACLLGCACRYDGHSKPNPLAQELARRDWRCRCARSSWAGCPRPENPPSAGGTGW